MKDEVLKEIDNLREDIALYHSGSVFLLTLFDNGNLDGKSGGTRCNEGGIDFINDETDVDVFKTKKKQYVPKSVLFRLLSTTFKKTANTDDQKKTIFWNRKKTSSKNDVIIDESGIGCYKSPRIIV